MMFRWLPCTGQPTVNQLLTMYRLHEQTASTKVRHWCRTEKCSLGRGEGGGG